MKTLSKKTIVVGSGGRESAIAWALAKSPLVEEVIVCPGNGGTASLNKCRNETGEPLRVAIKEHCTLAVIGPEVPLAEGLADRFRKAGIPCAGAGEDAALLESSKDFAKDFMIRHGVSCPGSAAFTDANEAKEYIKENGAPIVIKADGLAAGKGVTVAATVEDALKAVDDIMLSDRLDGAGDKVVIEDYLEGVEMSVLAAVSVFQDENMPEGVIVPFLPARDHKRLLDGANGPNTGGMGAVCPLPDADDKLMEEFNNRILQPTLEGLIDDVFDYQGFIFFGVMITKDGPKLLEYNVRLGDPETQAVLPLMESDFAALCIAITDGTLNDYAPSGASALKWKKGYVCAPCMVSSGYPGKYEKGKEITIGHEALDKTGAKIFIAGASMQDGANGGKLVTSGGRVLCASAFGGTLDEARDAAYKALDAIHFDGAFYRHDIGLPGAASSGKIG